MIIDSHQHFWRYDAGRDTWITPEMAVLKRDYLPADLRRELSANGVDASVAVQASQSEQETLFLLQLAGQHEEIAGVVGWVDLQAGNVKDRLEFFSQFPRLRGFRHIAQSEPDNNFLLGKDFCRGIACLRDFNFTYDLLIYPRQLPAAIELVKRFPQQPFVVDHLAKPLVRSGEMQPWAGQMEEMAAQRNAWCKLSGLITEAEWGKWTSQQLQPYLATVLKAFGPDRLMFGSDWPVCLLSGGYAQAKQLVVEAAAHLAPPQQQKIFGSNAISFYGLKPRNGLAAER
jgi:L-fuconolactonase